MPTVRDILNSLKFERIVGRDEGSCFGVTDPSRLRPAFYNPIVPLLQICKGCKDKKVHRCKKHFPVQKFKISKDEGVEATRKVEVMCECPSCKENQTKSQAT